MMQFLVPSYSRWSAAILPLVTVYAISAQVSGGTITVQDTSPNPLVTGAMLLNTESFTATQPTGSSVKLFGTGTFTNNGSNTGDGTIRIPLSGNFTAGQNERLFSTYNFSATRSGSSTGTVTYAVRGEATALGTTLTAGSSGTVASGAQTYVGSSQSSANPLPLTASGTYTAYLEITWMDGTAGDTLSINIPQNSIDFLIGTVPEPSSMGLFAIGGLLMARRRR